ncbi:hypothetical protein [Vogesella sp. XCS3]|nr:hypothetical protein [Vogesella sp. XCS3]UDM16389.1 hypothetical protein LCH97_13960 [Vogesella sp. XCS3]
MKRRSPRRTLLAGYRPRWRLADWVVVAIVLGAVLLMFLFLLGHYWQA